MSVRTKREQSGRRLAVVAGPVFAWLAALVFVAQATPLSAQAAADARWRPWLGCWEPADTEQRVVGDVGKTQRLCVVPAAGAPAVDIVTVTGGSVVERHRVVANGERRADTREGCTGWESAEWAKTGYRVYMRSEHTCDGGLRRMESGLLAFSATGEWLDLRSVTAGDNTGVRVYRFREVTDLSGMPAEIVSALRERGLASSAARTAASGLTLADIVDASRQLEAGVASAWLVERSREFTMKIDARMLAQLSDAGVKPQVIDVIVALAYPKVFALNPSTRTAEARPEERVGGRSMARGDRIRVVGYDAYGLPIYDWELSARCGYYSVLRSGCPFYGYSSYGSPYYGYSPYGYPYYGYGYRYGGGYGYGYGWYPGTQPVVVVVQTSQPTRERGRVVNGRGYSQGDRTTTSGPSSSTTRSGSSGSSGSSAGSSGASASSGRTAVPRKP